MISAHYAALAAPPTGNREARRRVQDAANNALLQQHLEGRRRPVMRFVCTLVALRSADDPEPLVATGRWHGELLREGAAGGGFGYDPLLTSRRWRAASPSSPPRPRTRTVTGRLPRARWSA